MSTTTPNMLLTKPDPDGSVGTWDTELNASLDVLDAHDHSSGSGVLIPVAGLNINADLPLANFALTQVKALAMAAVASSSVAALSRALFVNSADNELYWKTSGGVLVQLTSGTSLNAALLGGFTGDYGTGGSEANFNSGTSIYNFLRAVNHRAFLDTSDIRLFQGTSGIANAVKIRSPNSLAASYDFIFPAALPASTSLLQITSGGQVETTLAPSVTTLAASGLISANGGVTAASGTHFTVSGAGLYKRPARSRHISPLAGQPITGTGDFGIGTWTSLAGTDVFQVPLTVDAGERITEVQLRILPGGASAATMTVRKRDTNGTNSVLGSPQTTSGLGRQTLTVTGLTEDITDTIASYVVEIDAGQADDTVEHIMLFTSVP